MLGAVNSACERDNVGRQTSRGALVMTKPGKHVPNEPQTSMLYFYCANPQEVKSIREKGLSASGASLFDSLDNAERECGGRILVLNAYAVDGGRFGTRQLTKAGEGRREAGKGRRETGEGRRETSEGPAGSAETSEFDVPPGAVLNADPYARPTRVTAAGGFVTRRRGGTLELLLIFRRGTWDLPKGKLDAGEAVEDCAVREVREELGITDVELRRALGSTVHAYREKKRCMVKTTHWYEMATGADEFAPQAEEDIEKVSWMPWREARGKVGFETLRRHMDAVEGLL